MRIYTGIQPSGKLHIGNYFGAMKPMIEFMNASKDQIFVMVANYHALTSLHNAKELRENTNNSILDWLACGLDPEKVIFFVQSDLPEVQELTWFLHTVCPMGLLERAVSYKEKTEKGIPASSGLFTYPVLMSADILLMQAEKVPVGKDQKQHVEIARDIALKWNKEFGETFTIPEEVIQEEVAVIPGIDGQKMSKSYGNTIPLFDDEKAIRKKIMSIVTDSAGIDEPKNPDTCTVFKLYTLVSSEAEQEGLRKKYFAGGMGYGEAKTILFEAIKKYFSPFWEKRKELASQTGLIENIRVLGQTKARVHAQKTLEKVRKVAGI